MKLREKLNLKVVLLVIVGVNIIPVLWLLTSMVNLNELSQTLGYWSSEILRNDLVLIVDAIIIIIGVLWLMVSRR